MNKIKIKKCIVETSEGKAEFNFSESIVFYGKNGKGKSKLFGAILRPFGLNLNLNGEELNKPSSSIKTILINKKNGEEITLGWSKQGKKNYWYEIEDYISPKDTLANNASAICEFLNLPFTEKMKKEFGKSLWSQTILEQGAKFAKGLTPEYTQSSGTDEIYYSLWANSFINYFELNKTMDEIEEVNSKIKKNSKVADSLKGELRLLKSISLDDIENEVDEKIKETDVLISDLQKETQKYESLIAKKQLLNLLIIDDPIYDQSKKIFEGYFIEWQGAKITFADFISKIETNPKLKEEILEISVKLSNSRTRIGKFNNSLKTNRKKLKDIREGRDVFIHHDYDELKHRKERNAVEILELKKRKNTLNNIKTGFLSLLSTKGAEMYKTLENEGIKIRGINKQGDYRWFKLKTDSEIGFEALYLWIRANVFANKEKGALTPYIMDASDELADEDNLPKFIASLNELTGKNQIIITTHNKKVAKELENNGWVLKEIDFN